MSTSDTSSMNGGLSAQAQKAGAAPTLLDAFGKTGFIQAAILAALLFIIFWSSLEQVAFRRWIEDSDWSHGWLVPLFSLYFLNTRAADLARVERKTNYLGLVVVILALLAFAVTFTVFRTSYPRPILFLMAGAGLVLFCGGWQILKLVWFPIAFLVLAVPLPDSYYVALTQPLQRVGAIVAAMLLGLFPDLYTEVSGVVIDYSYKGFRGTLNVEQACAGMRLMMAFVTLGVAMAYLGDRPFWQRLVMLACCVPIAVFCNVIRVTLTGILHVFKDEPIGKSLHFETLSGGTPHALLGIAMLPIALGLYALIGWVLANLFVEAPELSDGSTETS